MPGSGKSFWASKLSKELNIPFIDLDSYLEEKENKSIPDIFREDGESKFRDLESHYLREVLNEGKKVILSLGGGTPCSKQNLLLLKEETLSIYLNANLDSLIQNLEKDISVRPKFRNSKDLKQDLKRLLEEREAYYKRADRKIDEPFSIHTLLKIIPDSIKN